MNGKLFRNILLGWLCFILGMFGFVCSVSATQVMIEGTASYLWHRGCVPTTMTDIFGFYDTHGYPNLLNETGSILLTDSVRPEIDLIADAMHTMTNGELG